MPPSLTWDLARVFGTWRNLDGSLKAGTYKVTIPVRVTDHTDDTIIPAGTFATGNLQTITNTSPSLDIQVPCTDDPDIDQTGWQVQVSISFADNSATENYSIDVPYANRPSASGGNGLGVDLRPVILASSTSAQTVGQYKAGVAGGLALLNGSGQVIDANGSPVTGSGGGGGQVDVDTHAATSKPTADDADEFPLADSTASFGLRKWTWANLKAAMKSYYDSATSTVTNKNLTSGTNTFPTFNQSTTGNAATATRLTTARTIDGQVFDGSANVTVIAPGTHAAVDKSAPVAADELPLVDSAASNALKKIKFSELSAAVLSGQSVANAVAGSVFRISALSTAARPSSRTDIFYEWITTDLAMPTNAIDGDTWLNALES